MADKKMPPGVPFKPGQSGNPGGKPKNARNRLQVKFLEALADDFETHGVKAIENARRDDPMGYVKAIVQLMPKQVEDTKPLDDVSDAELVAGIALLRAHLSAANVGEGVSDKAEPSQTH